MKKLIQAGTLTLLSLPGQAGTLSGTYTLTQAPYLSGTEDFCLKLVSTGPSGIYKDQGAAYMVPISGFPYNDSNVGEYQLYKNHLSLVLGNYGKYAEYWFLMTANIDKKQWTSGLFYDDIWVHYPKHKYFSPYNGTFTTTRVKGGCKPA